MRGNLSTHHHSYFLLNTSSVPVPCYPYRYHLQASPHREVGTIIISALQTRYQCSKAVTCPRSQRLEAVLHLEPHSSSSVATSWEPTPRPAWCLSPGPPDCLQRLSEAEPGQQPTHSDSRLLLGLTWPRRDMTFSMSCLQQWSPGLHQSRPEALVRESSSWK